MRIGKTTIEAVVYNIIESIPHKIRKGEDYKATIVKVGHEIKDGKVTMMLYWHIHSRGQKKPNKTHPNPNVIPLKRVK